MRLASWVPYHDTLLIGDTTIPLVRSKSSPPRTNDPARPPAVIDRQNEEEKKRYPGGLARVVSGMFYSVVANRR